MSFVSLEVSESIALVTIDREDKLNALSSQVLKDLADVLSQIEAKTEIRCAILTGKGAKAFVAGADISEMQPLDAKLAEEFALRGQAVFEAIEKSRVPFIAAVNGFALGGGCELALACDFVYAASNAKFGQPEVKLGVIPGFGGTQRLMRRVGIAHARELVYSGVIVGAEQALAIGLANRITPPEELLSAARATAKNIASMGPLAIAAAKRVMLEGEGLALTLANKLEAQAFGGLFATADQAEGMEAFLGKRAASFKGL